MEDLQKFCTPMYKLISVTKFSKLFGDV